MSTQKGIGALFVGMLTIVIGLILLNTVIDTATTTGSTAAIGSFTGTQSVNDLAPLIFASVVVAAGVGLVAVALAGFAGIGPGRRR